MTAELNNWLVNAFNGEWKKVAGAKPTPSKAKRDIEMVRKSGVAASGGQRLPLSKLSGLNL